MLRDFRFSLVKALSHLLRPLIKQLNLRKKPLVGQIELLPKRTVQWDRSKLTYIGPEPFWWKGSRFALDAAFKVELVDAEMLGKGVVIDREGEVILESTLFRSSYLLRSHVEHLIIGRKLMTPVVFENVIPLTNYLDISYFHWTLESMGRLAFVQEQLADTKWKVLINEGSSGFVRGTLKFLFGLDESRIITHSCRRKIMRHCLMASNPHSCDVANGNVEVYAPEHIRWLNRTGHERIGGVRSERHNIIITRRKQAGRHITNEDLLIERYPKLNFRFVILEDLSLPEQVDLFAHAGIIIGVHGAGFTNLVYATDAAVIEFYPTHLQEKNAAYFVQIAACLGLPHLLVHYTGSGTAPNWNLTLGEEKFEHMDRFLRLLGKI